MFDTIKSIVGDIASGAVKDQRIQLSQEQLAALDLKLREALERIRQLEAELQRYRQPTPKGVECPYCREHTGKLLDMQPHRQSLLRQMGVKIGLYRCTNESCNKEYERQIPP
jgi:hypothetical protein